MKEFYKELTSKITGEEAIEKFTEKNVKAVAMVDLYKGQYLYEKEFEQLLLPAVLVEYNINHDTNTATISLHCCWEQIYETDNKSADRESALLFFDWQDVLYDLVYQLETKNTGKLKLITEGLAQDESPTTVHIFSFECSYMGRVKKAIDGYNQASGEDVTTTGTIKTNTQQVDFNFD
ncbi:hypothetical protein FUA48_16150 [Flavobacterium alkalisoli]|uniref:Uncharacterized protein n=1 Tax=Flavobacterium alkalisoli TaxID=2602769 RepID=A0A5B9G0V1_9FLAO|nr:hypothetical protein [Flavobacterium alkalisoli]QEE51052.1 hypothetical protein FUA48_16150 [Flavobacterium alkalisoli]